MLDRLQTIESHRFLTANNISKDNGNYSGHCIRGLEIFQEENSNEHFRSKKKLYHSTIHMEQMRQAMLGINDPERYRELVSSQSDLALHRAQELAAQDAREAYFFNESSSSVYKPSKSVSTTLPDSTNNGAESGSASIVSDVSSTGSTESSSTSNNTGGQSVFADETIRKLQERSMRRLMGIYQNHDGEGAQESEETHGLFKFARKDSLVGIRNKKLAASAIGNASRRNSSWAVPAAEKKAPCPQQQVVGLIRHQQILQEQPLQKFSDDTAVLEEQIAEMLRQREILQEHIRQQKQLQQQAASAMNTAPSLQEQLMEMMERRRVLQGHGQQYQTVSSDLDTHNGGSTDGTTTTSLIEKYLIQQRQRHQDHKYKMKLALMAMNANRFPIRRDTLNHVPAEPSQNNAAPMTNKHTLSWGLSGLA